MKEHFGRTGEDVVTGYRGVITGYAEYMTGCEQVLLIPRCDPEKETERPEGEWFDTGRIKLVAKRSGAYKTLLLSTDLIQNDDGDGDERRRRGGLRTDKVAPKR